MPAINLLPTHPQNMAGPWRSVGVVPILVAEYSNRGPLIIYKKISKLPRPQMWQLSKFDCCLLPALQPRQKQGQ